MSRACCLAVPLVAAVLLLSGCSGSPDAPAARMTGQPSDSELPAIERYRSALTGITESQQALALETAQFNDEDWSGVAQRSLAHANELQGRIERLMEFDEAVPAAATLRQHVASLQRQLQAIDAENWKSALPDLLLMNESIQSDVDELTDLAAPGPDEMPVHDHDLAGESHL